MDEDPLTLEQRFLLARIRQEAQSFEPEALVAALCDAWEARFRLKRTFILLSQQAGWVFQLEERQPLPRLESDEECRRLFGYIPSAEERAAFLKHQHETVTMDLDMEAIVRTPDEDD